MTRETSGPGLSPDGEVSFSTRTLVDLVVRRELGARKTLALVGLSGGAVVLEVLGISLFYPLLSALLGVRPDASTFLPQGNEVGLLGGLFLILMVFTIRAGFQMLTYRYLAGMVADAMRRCAQRLAKRYLYEPSADFGLRDPESIVRNMTHFVRGPYQGFLLAFGQAAADSMLALGLVAVALAVSPVAMAITAIVLMVLISFQRFVFGRIFYKLGTQSADLAAREIDQINTMIEAGQELRVFRIRDAFLGRFADLQEAFQRNNTLFDFYRRLPPVTTEWTFLIGFTVTIIIMWLIKGEGASLVTDLAVLAIVAFRGIPAGNRLSQSLNTLDHSRASLSILLKEVYGCQADVSAEGRHTEDEVGGRPSEIMSFRESLQLDAVSLRYSSMKDSHNESNGGKPAGVRDVDLVVWKGEFVCISGPSGAGKSTVVGLALGLLEPQQGVVRVDGVPRMPGGEIDSVAYVPQSPFIMNASISTNVRFDFGPDDFAAGYAGEVAEGTDTTEVDQALRDAGLNSFADELSVVDRPVGARGARLSGGQMKRLALARALFRKPGLLVLDEVTAGLDLETERRLIQRLSELKRERAILCVTHRPEVLSAADRIYILREGRVAAVGSFQELREKFDMATLLGESDSPDGASHQHE